MESRITSLRKLLSLKNLDALLVSIPENRYYLSGFTGEDGNFDESAGVLIITQKELVLLTDSRFTDQASIEAPNYIVLSYKTSLADKLSNVFDRLAIKNIGFEGNHISFKEYNKYLLAIENTKNSKSIKTITSTEGFVESIRVLKSEYEINQTRKAVKIAEKSFQKLLTIVKPGMTEKKTAWIFEKIMRESGADCLSFPVIVASGINSAMPHAKVTNRKLAIGEPILFDWGVKIGKYCSDTSRTIVLGAPNDKFKNIYNTVLEAQKKAINSIKNGVSVKVVDNIARKCINNKGFHGKFKHSLGHGTGLSVHEAPRISKHEATVFKSGMIVTIEPGIYIPNWGGIRIENQIVIHENYCEILNQDKLFSYQIER